MQRITTKHLRAKVDSLNAVFGFPSEPYADARDERGGLIANAGTFTLDCAYGGYRLCQMCAGGGERDLTLRANARETLNLIAAFAHGAEHMRKHMTSQTI